MSTGLTYRIAIVGQPKEPDLRFDDQQLSALKQLGFNAIQLNIAWSWRPADEPLNLEDIVTVEGTEPAAVVQRRQELRRRIAMCRKYGFRTLFHFGAPKMLHYPEKIGIADCIMLKETRERYRRLLSRFAESCPGVDDILVYTYDQAAWLCSEFGECPRCRTIPLSERLPAFLKLLCDTWRKHNPNGIMWWEPWELSAGQSLAIIPHLPRSNFGLMLHSNIAEVQASRPVDCWFRNVARLASEHGLPVAGEVFLSRSSEEIEPLRLIMPRIVYQQIAAVRSVTGITGIKEYYGLLPDRFDPNLAMAGIMFHNPDLGLAEALQRISEDFGAAREGLLQAWEMTASAFEIYPWDLTWFLRSAGYLNPCHGWNSAYIHAETWDTPSWHSTRRAIFAATTSILSPHPWLLEDAALRFGTAQALFAGAAKACETLLPMLPQRYTEEIALCVHDLAIMQRACRTYQLHIQESLMAWHIRRYTGNGQTAPDHLYARLRELLELDAINQKDSTPLLDGIKTAKEMLAEYNDNPARWVENNLLPVADAKPFYLLRIPGVIISKSAVGITTQ